VHDDILNLSSLKKPHVVVTVHDYASLAFTVIAILYGDDGLCPWKSVYGEPSITKSDRDDWLKTWRSQQSSQVSDNRDIIEMLLSGAYNVAGMVQTFVEEKNATPGQNDRPAQPAKKARRLE
jgi:hypothetical protein